MNVEAWAQYISFFAPTENVFSLGQGYAIDTGASGLPSECPPLAVEYRQYLAHKNGELQEITQHLHGDDARSTDKLGLTKELSGRLKSTVEELHAGVRNHDNPAAGARPPAGRGLGGPLPLSLARLA